MLNPYADIGLSSLNSVSGRLPGRGLPYTSAELMKRAVYDAIKEQEE